jgi:hypothetical protein
MSMAELVLKSKGYTQRHDVGQQSSGDGRNGLLPDLESEIDHVDKGDSGIDLPGQRQIF